MRIIELKRFFFPVGQGNFCAEIFETECGKNSFSMVYDCGTTKKNNDKFEGFFKEFPKNRKVDICFISHFHKDHISHIDFLIEKIGVKKIVIPKLSVEEKIISVLSDEFVYYCKKPYLSREKDKTKKLEEINQILSLKQYLKEKEIEIIEVIREENHEKEAYKDEKEFIDMNGVKEIKSGISLINDKIPPKWIFKVFNIVSDKIKDREKRIKEELERRNIKIQGNSISESDFDKVVAIYKKIFMSKEHNEYSLILYSGYLELNNEKSFLNRNTACLYTGDSIFKDILKNNNLFFKRLRYESVGTLQVPHHGAKENFVEELFNNKITAIICARKGNRWHPSKEVLSCINQNQSKEVILTEDDDIYSEKINL